MIELPNELIDKSGDCWIWCGAKHKEGYGIYKGKRVNRIVLENKLGRPVKYYALHLCGVASCCNPEHIYEGTHEDNMRDMKRHGTHDGKNRRGEKHPRSKLSNKQREEIKISKEKGVKLAAKYKVSKSSISQIRGKQKRLTKKQEEQIKTSNLSCIKLAQKYPVSASTIFNIRKGNYGH